jgi:hypothetical protein
MIKLWWDGEFGGIFFLVWFIGMSCLDDFIFEMLGGDEGMVLIVLVF